MLKLFILFGVSVIFFIAFVFFFIMGMTKKYKKDLLISAVFFFLSGAMAIWGFTVFADKAIGYTGRFFRPRTGMEIYTALFKAPETKCVSVPNHKDQLVPRLDCCIWLEIRTCPQEIIRIVAQRNYTSTTHFASDTSGYVPDYSPRPDWWTPIELGDSVTVLRDFTFDDPNHDKVLVISKDSTHAFYCDMAD
jgi:hypothetical protein